MHCTGGRYNDCGYCYVVNRSWAMTLLFSCNVFDCSKTILFLLPEEYLIAIETLQEVPPSSSYPREMQAVGYNVLAEQRPGVCCCAGLLLSSLRTCYLSRPCLLIFKQYRLCTFPRMPRPHEQQICGRSSQNLIVLQTHLQYRASSLPLPVGTM